MGSGTGQQKPNTPTQLLVSQITQTQALVTWTVSVGGAAGYRLYLNGSAVTPDVVGNSRLLSGLTAGTVYSVILTAVDALGVESDPTAAYPFTTAATPPPVISVGSGGLGSQSEVVICNLALSHLGNDATISSLTEASVEAEKCSRFYPLSRDTALATHSWSFATKRTSLALVADTQPSYLFGYEYPSDCLDPLAVLAPGATDDARSEDYTLELGASGRQVVYTNCEQATLRYIARVQDPTKFSPLLVNAISCLLASYLVGPLLKGKTATALRRDLLQSYAYWLAQAKELDANAVSVRATPVHTAPWISGR